MPTKKPPTVWGSLSIIGQLGFTVAIPIALFAFGGNYLDGVIHTNHIFLLLGLLLGLITGVYGAYRLFSRVL